MGNKGYFQHQLALVDDKALIGNGTRIWAFVNVQPDAVIGSGCNICDGCFIESGVRVGNNVTLKNGVNIWQGITLEDDVFCGSQASFINDRRPRGNRPDPWKLEQTIVKRGATIGTNATILCGVTIGEYAFVGAGSVVPRDVPPYSLVIGNPAVFKSFVCRCGSKLGAELSCSCGLRYSLTDKVLSLKK